MHPGHVAPGLSPGETRALLSAALDAAGISAHAYLSGAALRGVMDGLAVPTDLRRRYGVEGAAGCVAVALAYGEGEYPPPAWTAAWTEPGDGAARARLGRFVRADWYYELTARLSAAVGSTREALRARGADAGGATGWRRLSNSPIPERAAALRAGLGWIGRNGMLVVDHRSGRCDAGSAVVLGLLLLPFDPGDPGDPGGFVESDAAARPLDDADARRGSRCGDCRRCVDACPTGALSRTGFEREKCLQHWSTIPGALPSGMDAAWEDRIYGCDTCLEACPHFRPEQCAAPSRGILGPSLPARFFTESDDATIRDRLRGTALSLGWMDPAAFRRNARLAIRFHESRG